MSGVSGEVILPHSLPPAPLALWGGAECTINRVGDCFFDQLVIAGHADRDGDLARFASLGLSALRYPLLWESFARSDDPPSLWAWHEERLAELRRLGIRPIIGLIHHGSGPQGTDLLAPGFAEGLAAHARAAAERFPWVRDWTPVNEPLTTARFAALYGHWYPHLRDERAFWRALLNQIDATRAAMTVVRGIHSGARLIQTEDMGRTDATPKLRGQAEFYNLRRWASWDLLTGRLTEKHPLWERLAAMGFERDLASIRAVPCPPDVLGLNHYLTSDRFLDHRVDAYPDEQRGLCAFGALADVETIRALGAAPGLEAALLDTWDRYGLPMAITEVHNGCTREEQMRWLSEAWATAERLRGDGLSIEAVTAWSLLGAHDWDKLLTQQAGHYESGVFDIRGSPPRETALAPLLRGMAMGKTPTHPVLARRGWWRAHAQTGPGPDDAAAARRPLLIAGATGTLGQAFAGACRLRGIDHVLTGRRELDLTDSRSIIKALDEYRPWALVDCTGWVRVDEAEHRTDDCMAVNFYGTVALARACAERDIHHTSFSSDLVFDGAGDRPYLEHDKARPLSVYGMSKARADAAIPGLGGRNLRIRTSSFFSPFDAHNFAAHLARALRAGRSFAAASDCTTSPSYVPDLVRITLDLIIDDEQGLWHLANDGAVTWSRFAFDLADALRLPVKTIEPRPAGSMPWTAMRPRFAPLTSARGIMMPSLSSAIDRFVRELELQPTPPE